MVFSFYFRHYHLQLSCELVFKMKRKKIRVELLKIRSQMSNLLIPDELFDDLERREEELIKEQECEEANK